MPRPGEDFACQVSFEEHPEPVGLIDLWSARPDVLDAQKEDRAKAKKLLDQFASEMYLIVHGMLMQQRPDIDPDERIEEINMTNAGLWSTRAMLAASSIKREADALTPEEFV